MGGPASTTEDDVLAFESGPRVGQGGCEEWRADGFGRSHTRRREMAHDTTRTPPQPATRDTQPEALVVEEVEDEPIGFAAAARRRVVDGTDDVHTSQEATCAPLQPEPPQTQRAGDAAEGAGVAAKRVRPPCSTSTTSNPRQDAATKPPPEPPIPPVAPPAAPHLRVPRGASLTNILHRVSINRRAAVLPEVAVDEVKTVNLKELEEERERSSAEASSSQEQEEQKPVLKRQYSLLPRFSTPETSRCRLLPASSQPPPVSAGLVQTARGVHSSDPTRPRD
jgi:hypothetical protein